MTFIKKERKLNTMLCPIKEMFKRRQINLEQKGINEDKKKTQWHSENAAKIKINKDKVI